MARILIISVDYEIFGNGVGDVRQHITEPAERMARICEAHNVPLTVFFEVEEYFAFLKHRKQLTGSLGYDPALEIRTQIHRLVQRGHDIQLHLHPEWYGASLLNGRWQLADQFQTVDSLFESQAETTSYIAERKAMVDDILATAGSSQRVSVYRAGAFSAQPSNRLLRALHATGIRIDSSVVKGLTRSNPHVHFDYRGAPCNKGPWRVSTDVATEDPSGQVWEFPIYSVLGRRWQQATPGRLRAKFSNNVPEAQRKRMAKQLGLSRNPFQVIRLLLQPIPIKLDYHNLTPTALMRYIRFAPSLRKSVPDVLVLIGHTKEHVEDRQFSEFLSRVRSGSENDVSGFSSIAKDLPAVADRLAPLEQC